MNTTTLQTTDAPASESRKLKPAPELRTKPLPVTFTISESGGSEKRRPNIARGIRSLVDAVAMAMGLVNSRPADGTWIHVRAELQPPNRKGRKHRRQIEYAGVGCWKAGCFASSLHAALEYARKDLAKADRELAMADQRFEWLQENFEGVDVVMKDDALKRAFFANDFAAGGARAIELGLVGSEVRS